MKFSATNKSIFLIHRYFDDFEEIKNWVCLSEYFDFKTDITGFRIKIMVCKVIKKLPLPDTS